MATEFINPLLLRIKWCCCTKPPVLTIACQVIMTYRNRKSGWECIPSQNNLGVTLRLECGWLLAENTHQLEEWPWCGVMTLCEEAGGAKSACFRQLLARLPPRHSYDYLWNSSHASLTANVGCGRKTFTFHADNTAAVSNSAGAVKCSFTVMHVSGQQSLCDYL